MRKKLGRASLVLAIALVGGCTGPNPFFDPEGDGVDGGQIIEEAADLAGITITQQDLAGVPPVDLAGPAQDLATAPDLAPLPPDLSPPPKACVEQADCGADACSGGFCLAPPYKMVIVDPVDATKCSWRRPTGPGLGNLFAPVKGQVSPPEAWYLSCYNGNNQLTTRPVVTGINGCQCRVAQRLTPDGNDAIAQADCQ